MRDYQLWRVNKQAEYQMQCAARLETRNRQMKALGRWLPIEYLPAPNLSHKAFIEEYEDSMPLDH